MASVNTVLVVGSGPAGSATAALLADAGVAVDVVELTQEVSTVGSGITLQGNALRVLQQLGVYADAASVGYEFNTLGLRAPDPDGTLLVAMEDFRTGGPDLPATLGMFRPELARILIGRAEKAGAKFRFGTTVDSLTQDASSVDVVFSDGSSGTYDLVVAADGIRSHIRELIGVDLTPIPIGMGIWRVFAARPASVTQTDLIYGGNSYIAGYCPTSEESLYAYIVEPAQDRSGLSPAESLKVVQELAGHYHGPWDDISASLVDVDQVNYTKFETHFLDGPWNRGRVVLIGDAAHSCPPTAAQGAAMALEDAAVLTELLVAASQVDESLWAAFSERRHDRVKTVIDGSVQLTSWLIAHEQGDVPGLMARVSAAVSQPA